MTSGEKIRKLRKSIGLTQTELGEKLGVKKNAVSKWETGRVEDIPMPQVKAMSKLFSVPASYLIDDDIASLSSHVPGAFEVPGTKLIPLLGRTAAGLPLFAEENIEGYIWTDKNHGAEYFGLRVEGDSMNAAGIKDGDVVIVRKQEELQPNEIGVILVDDGATIKRMQRQGNLVVLNPQSTNPANTPQMYDLKEHTIKIIGKVVESRTEF